MLLPKNMIKLIEFFSRLPGVGEKSSQRFIFSLLKWNSFELQEFSSLLNSLSDLNTCKECGTYSDDDLCSVCSDDERRSSKVICVVENIVDLIAIEKGNLFKGKYHILGGVLNPLNQIGPKELTINKLLLRIKDKGVLEIILALNPSVEGDITCSYLREIIPSEVRVERLGQGIPVGGSLEYLDSLTILKAIENRRTL